MNINFLSIIRSSFITATLLFTLTGNSFAMDDDFAAGWAVEPSSSELEKQKERLQEVKELWQESLQHINKATRVLWNHKKKIILITALMLFFVSNIKTFSTDIPTDSEQANSSCSFENWTLTCRETEEFGEQLVHILKKFTKSGPGSCSDGLGKLNDYLTFLAEALFPYKECILGQEQKDTLSCILDNCSAENDYFENRCHDEILHLIRFKLDILTIVSERH